MTSPLRHLPSIDALLRADPDLSVRYGHDQTVRALRQIVEEAREAVLSGDPLPTFENLLTRAAALLESESLPTLRSVINATGVILHTNLGRAPLSDAAIEAMRAAAAGYSTLEYDLQAGERGKRDRHIERILADVTGAEAGMVVNNNAAGVLLALSALAQGREVIISRGQLVEIGGGFRIPDVMRQSGAIMVEVGTTNRTHRSDYEDAVTQATALLVRAHASNFRMVGFTESVPVAELAEIAHAGGLLLVDDIGSGALIDPAPFGLSGEPTVSESLRAGADLVLFSGDKLLGGPQAGIIIGKAELIDRLKRHPLARAIRADKLCIAALMATLDHYRRGEALSKIPVWRMISMSLDTIRTRVDAWAAAVGGEVIAAQSTVGGGSLPGETLPSWAYVPAVDAPNAAAAKLRLNNHPPIIARVTQDRLLLDPRTVLPEQDALVLAALKNL